MFPASVFPSPHRVDPHREKTLLLKSGSLQAILCSVPTARAPLGRLSLLRTVHRRDGLFMELGFTRCSKPLSIKNYTTSGIFIESKPQYVECSAKILQIIISINSDYASRSDRSFLAPRPAKKDPSFCAGPSSEFDKKAVLGNNGNQIAIYFPLGGLRWHGI